MTYQLHIDLLRCEHCGQHNKLLDFCSACGRARKTLIVVPLYEHKDDRPSSFRCRSCFSQRSMEPFCLYCNRGMKMVNRPIVEHYVDGFIRDVYADTMEVVEDQPRHPVTRMKVKNKSYPTQPARKRVFQRDRACLRCQTQGNLTVHHIRHRSRGGSNDTDNLQTLCEPCHRYVHEVLCLPSGIPYVHVRTQEDEDREWVRIQRERAKKHGKKHYKYGKDMATNFAAPFIARLRK